ncbi:hypothetical protein UlMin_003794 [Ulmus minor]
MELSDSHKIVYNRIQELEPENVRRIIGYIMLQDHSDNEMIRLAAAPDHVLRQAIIKAKVQLPHIAAPSPRSISSMISPPAPGFPPFSSQFSSLDDYLSGRTSRRVACHYFNKGFCKHGNSCRYLHEQIVPQMLGSDSSINDCVFSSGSLEKLEFEIIELLKSKRGNPVSIASLPLLYYDKYGKYLQAEGYLTESQRHGKAGYSLTKLIARLSNSIRLIESRPHGQHAVILAEDLPKHVEKCDPGPIVSGARQIYLTFPAESSFSEEDVSNYFSSAFGPVEDVRIPCQQKRMFGFVTFASADTVKTILAKGNPHFVCGARVLVKPYREKSKLADRKYMDRMEAPVYYSPNYPEMESELQSMSRAYNHSMLRKQLIEEHEQQALLEFERRRLAELQLARKPVNNNQSYLGYSTDGLKLPKDHFNFPSSEQFDYLLDIFNNDSATDDNFKQTDTNCTNPDSQAPDSPFSSSLLPSSISTFI